MAPDVPATSDLTVADTSSPEVLPSPEEAERILIAREALRVADRRYPADEPLEAFLATALSTVGLAPAPRLIVSRDNSLRWSTYTNEIVTCRLATGDTLQLLCKYAGEISHAAFGHRRGIEYEVGIYRDVLPRLALSTPRYYGHRFEPATGEHWLAMEYVDGGKAVSKGPQPATVISAAQWIGTFHARSPEVIDTALLDTLIQYDHEYLAGWARRASRFAEPLRGEYPWFGTLCERFVDHIPRLLALPRTMIHGEYTVHNVLLREPRVPAERWKEVAARHGGIPLAPIDWESAAVSFGEIDLAFLLDAWPDAVRSTSTEAYQRARWGADSPPDFEERFQAAQLYLHLRWLGDRPEKTLLRRSSRRFDRLHALGRQLRLL